MPELRSLSQHMGKLTWPLAAAAAAVLAACSGVSSAGSGSSSGGTSSTGGASSATSGTGSGSGGTSASGDGGSSGSTGASSCTADSDCAAPAPFCDTASGSCVECRADADCGSGFSCQADGSCWQASCPNSANTEASSTVTSSGCVLRVRDTSACRAARLAQGLSGPWLKFTCRLTLTRISVNGQDFVQISSDDEPDYKSLYFGTGNACYETDDTRTFPDPNDIVAQSMVMAVPLAPSSSSGTNRVSGGSVGIAVDGVALFSDVAGPGDDIYQESGSFDRCQGHPQNTGVYHHHTEPYGITQDDDALVGVMRDGYFVYGRKDPDGTEPGAPDGGLSAPYYGHTGFTVDSPSVAVFHYHVHYETNGTESAYFITPQTYYGKVVGTCTNGASGC